jgi:hypothetical protein
MPQNFLSCDRDQPLLLPPDLREWLPEDRLAWFVIEAIEELNLKRSMRATSAEVACRVRFRSRSSRVLFGSLGAPRSPRSRRLRVQRREVVRERQRGSRPAAFPAARDVPLAAGDLASFSAPERL